MEGHHLMDIKPHELMALRYLSTTPDRIRIIEDENTLAAAVVYTQLAKRGLVEIDNEDGTLVTITAGLSHLSQVLARDGDHK
jgi:hypothetical protein